jgi:folate-binding protein YgfZ
MTSPLLSRPGAVVVEGGAVAAHYGDPLREQRLLAEGAGLVDLVLSPHGHVEHHLVVADLGGTTWADVEPGTGAALQTFLERMRFMLRVEPALVTEQWAVLSLVGPKGTEVLGAAGLPAPEVPWLRTAVHLDKGCYRGQETVARVHNLGRPPRRLVLLHLDGVSEVLAEPGTPVLAGTREVGRVGSVVRHHELGVIALALVKQSVAMDAALTVAGSAAAIDPDDAPAEVDDTVSAARDRVRAVRSATIGR